MKIQITIPDSAIADVTEYCRAARIDLHGRMQQKLDNFIRNALEQREQWRQAKEERCQP